MIDGQFGIGEWDGAVRLQGRYTDLYLDYQAPYLYALNDWRANPEDIRPDCYNSFSVRVGGVWIGVAVYGDGHIEVDGAELEGKGAYSFSSSPRWATLHTIYEFRLAVPGNGSICVRLKDPVGGSSCDDLVSEPVSFSISRESTSIRVASVPDEGVTMLGEGEACGRGEGICREGLSCVEMGARATCMWWEPPLGDDGRAGSSDAATDVLEEVPADVVADVPDDALRDGDPDGPREDGPW